MNNLRDWTAQIRARGATLTVADTGVTHLRGPGGMTDHDRHMIARHRWALTVAAAGAHPDWWKVVLGHADPHALELPPADGHPTEWGCACCGAPATTVDPDSLLAWCDAHA